MKGINGSGTFQVNDPHIELLRAVALCHPGWASLRRLTFVPDLNSSPTWLRWKEEVFFPVLLPEMEKARFACAGGDCRALAICDAAMDSALAPDMREASRAAGTALMAGYSAPKSEKLWLRYRALLNSGKVPGHLAIVCALRGTAFHLSPAAIVGAYLFIEAKGGLPLDGIALWVNVASDCLTKWHSLKDCNLRAA
ncbi:MAG TPA: urease accessory UreF family protein [Terrimicrobiaceae bacterium]